MKSVPRSTDKDIAKLRRLQTAIALVRKFLGAVYGTTFDGATAAFIALTAETVSRALHDLLLPVDEEYVNFGFFVLSFRETVLESMGWCLHLAFKMRRITPNLVDWSLHSGLIRDQGGSSHSECSAKECLMHRQLYSNQEGASHHSRCSETSCEDVRIDEKSMESICAILLDGNIPLLQISGGSNGTPQALNVVCYKAGMKYIAISHVWSQGKMMR